MNTQINWNQIHLQMKWRNKSLCLHRTCYVPASNLWINANIRGTTARIIYFLLRWIYYIWITYWRVHHSRTNHFCIQMNVGIAVLALFLSVFSLFVLLTFLQMYKCNHSLVCSWKKNDTCATATETIMVTIITRYNNHSNNANVLQLTYKFSIVISRIIPPCMRTPVRPIKVQ